VSPFDSVHAIVTISCHSRSEPDPNIKGKRSFVPKI